MNVDKMIWLAAAITTTVAAYKLLRSSDKSSPSYATFRKLRGVALTLYFAGLFRAFVFQLFVIPSLSMTPGLIVSDYVAVSMHAYDLKLPFLSSPLARLSNPGHGDVIVFDHPAQPGLDYIKRIAATPGDTISYRGKVISINGHPIQMTQMADYKNTERDYSSKQFIEANGVSTYKSIQDPDAPPYLKTSEHIDVKECRYFDDGLECVVPSDAFFVIGDNRDNSIDSRSWGFVPRKNIKGKAVVILFNPGKDDRIGMKF